MPTYDYVCRACEHRFEHFQSMQEASLRKCPECGRMRLERLIGSGAGILFKGSGFYETDYKHKSGVPPSTEGSGKSGGDGDSGAKASGKSGSKPDGKSDATSDATSDSKSDSKSGPTGEAKGDSKPDSKAGGGDGPGKPSTRGRKES
jgi:putative FmdB family regulatory protein